MDRSSPVVIQYIVQNVTESVSGIQKIVVIVTGTVNVQIRVYNQLLIVDMEIGLMGVVGESLPLRMLLAGVVS